MILTWLVGLVLTLAIHPAGAAVTLEYFRVTAQAGGANLVEWQTATELDTIAFRLFRTAAAAPVPWGGTPLVTEQARGGNVTGATYTYTDTAVLPGNTYFYWLQEVTSNGTTSEFEPKQIGGTLPTATATATATPTRTATSTSTPTPTVIPGGSGDGATATRQYTNTPAPATLPPTAGVTPSVPTTAGQTPAATRTGTPGAPLVTTPTGLPAPALTLPVPAPTTVLTRPATAPASAVPKFSPTATITRPPTALAASATPTESPTPVVFGPKATGQPLVRNTSTPAMPTGEAGRPANATAAFVGGAAIVLALIAGGAGLVIWRRRGRT